MVLPWKSNPLLRHSRRAIYKQTKCLILLVVLYIKMKVLYLCDNFVKSISKRNLNNLNLGICLLNNGFNCQLNSESILSLHLHYTSSNTIFSVGQSLKKKKTWLKSLPSLARVLTTFLFAFFKLYLCSKNFFPVFNEKAITGYRVVLRPQFCYI